MVAIIGSRNASAAGLAFTERLARDLASAGFVIVSGLARGVDARAHRATLGTGTIAVLAGGLDRIYPPEHEQLAEDLTLRGALVTEMPNGWEARGRDFPRRNRIVSGLALGTVVIEAARSSGSLITARFAAEQGREIFAVPGSPLDPRAEGTNGLLREGATLCTGAHDVIDALRPMIGHSFDPPEVQEGPEEPREPLWDEWDLGDDETPVPSVNLRQDFEEPAQSQITITTKARSSQLSPADRGDQISELLGPTPVSIDDLVRAAGFSVAEVTSTLLDLELAGSLERHRGGLVSKAVG
jgi:DNA processing protein